MKTPTLPASAPKTYTIRDGCAFVGGDGQRLAAGQTIELADDVAALHLDRLELAKPGQAPTQSATTTDED